MRMHARNRRSDRAKTFAPSRSPRTNSRRTDMRFRTLTFACVIALGFTGSCSRDAAPTRAGSKKSLTVAVIPKGTTHVFWKSVEAGAKQAGAALGVEIAWKGALKEDDRAQQIQLVQQFIAQKIDGIALAPL